MTEETTVVVEDDIEGLDFTETAGFDAMVERARRAGSGEFLPYLSLKDGKSIVLRFLNDLYPNDKPIGPGNPVSVITIDMHSTMPTKAAPKRKDGEDTGKWPTRMSAACRNDRLFRPANKPARYPNGCTFCKLKGEDGKPLRPRPSTFALAQVRKEVTEGNTTYYVDQMRKVAFRDDDGEVTEEFEVPEIVVVQQGKKNFWDPMKTAAGKKRTILACDYVITRTGSGQNDTEYAPEYLDPTEIEIDGKVMPYDLRNPEIMQAVYPDLPDLRQVVARLAGPAYLGKFFLDEQGNYVPSDGTGKGRATSRSSGPAAVDNDVASAKVAEMRRFSVPNPPADTGEAEAAPKPSASDATLAKQEQIRQDLAARSQAVVSGARRSVPSAAEPATATAGD
jgi:hypothetical protein